MTTINASNPAAAAVEGTLQSAARAAGGGEFAGALRSYASASETTTPLSSPTIIGPLLLQEISIHDRGRRDRDARDRGRGLLDALAALKRAMLTSGDEQPELAKLTDLLSSIPQADDPALAALVRAIAARAAVELCRREMA